MLTGCVFLQSEKHLYRVFVDLGADDAELAGDVRAAVSDVGLTRHVVEVDPVAVLAGDDALGAEDHAEITAVELFKGCLDRCDGEGLRCLKTDGIEDFVRMVVTLVIVVMAAAGAVRAMIVVMFMLVVMIVMVFMFVVIMVMMFVLIVVVIMMMFMLMFVVMLIMIVMVVMVLVLFRFEERSGHVICGERVLDRFTDLCAGELLPRCCDDLGVIVDLANQLDRGVELALCDISGTGQDDGARVLDLVLVEFLEVLQVDFALACIDDGNSAADLGTLDLLNSGNDIGEFTDAGGLDEDPVRSELVDDFLQRGAEVADERAADAARVHLGDLDAGFLEKTAVNADLAEFVLDEDELLSVVAIGDEFLDKSGFSGA